MVAHLLPSCHSACGSHHLKVGAPVEVTAAGQGAQGGRREQAYPAECRPHPHTMVVLARHLYQRPGADIAGQDADNPRRPGFFIESSQND